MTQLGDEILIACADEELGPEQIRLVDGILARDKPTMAQYRQHIAIGQALSGAFSSMLEAGAKQLAAERLKSAAEAQPLPVAEQQRQTLSSKKNLIPAIAAGVLLVVFGAAGGYLAGNRTGRNGAGGDPFATANFWNREQIRAEEKRTKALFRAVREPDITAATPRPDKRSVGKWFERVALRHQQDVPRLFDQYEGKSRNPELALFQFSGKGIEPAMIPVLKEDDLTFVGASPVRIGGQTYARLVYRDISNGAVPVTLYIGKTRGGTLTLERGYRDNDNYVRWSQDDYSYMLIGAVPHWRLIVLSVAVQRQLVR